MSKGTTKKETVKRISQLPVLISTAAGIDVSDKEMMVAYPINSEQLEVRSFGCFTCDLHAIARCLKQANITSIAMESTGVYWISLFLILQEYEFEVYLVNASHVKNVTGRKDDETDAEWIQKLHSCGLLQPSFQPDLLTRDLRDLVRQRKTLVQESSKCINRMQKAMEQMNLKLHTIISDIDGKTGLSIIEAILKGERDPEILADLRDKRIQASREDIIKSLEGTWNPVHMLVLKQNYQIYNSYHQLISETDREIEQTLLAQIAAKNDGVVPRLLKSKRKVGIKNKISFDLTAYIKAILEVDVTQIVGISEISALTILSEVGTDMTKWKTERHFVSWLGLAPNTKKSGGKVISSKIKKKKHHAGQAFRMGASSLYGSKNALGDFYRRIRSKSGGPEAVVATAHKLAIIYYKMVSKKEGYDPKAMEAFQEKYKKNKINQLKKKLAQLQAA